MCKKPVTAPVLSSSLLIGHSPRGAVLATVPSRDTGMAGEGPVADLAPVLNAMSMLFQATAPRQQDNVPQSTAEDEVMATGEVWPFPSSRSGTHYREADGRSRSPLCLRRPPSGLPQAGKNPDPGGPLNGR